MINILSIDWDYFVNSTIFQRSHFFPDGDNENLTPEGYAMLWNKSYAHSAAAKEYTNGEKSIAEITVSDGEMEALYALVKRYTDSPFPSTSLSVHESHRDIAEIISRVSDETGDKRVYVFNIDSHHDCDSYVSQSEIDSGNWGRILFKEKKIRRLFWVKRKDSDDEQDNWSDVVCGGRDDINRLHEYPETLSHGIDRIFICRSTAKTPPHLDEKLTSMVETLKEILGIERVIGLSELTPRWTKQDQDEIGYLTGMEKIIKAHHFDKANNEASISQGSLQDKIDKYHSDYCTEHSIDIDESQMMYPS